jgi:hypothetical protein
MFILSGCQKYLEQSFVVMAAANAGTPLFQLILYICVNMARFNLVVRGNFDTQGVTTLVNSSCFLQ